VSATSIEQCSICDTGYYKDYEECIPCPFPFTTLNPGAQSVSQCNIDFKCPRDGEMTSVTTTGSTQQSLCNICKKGYFGMDKSKTWIEETELCRKCFPGYTTLSTNSTKETDCSVCDKGHKMIDGVCTYVCYSSAGTGCCRHRLTFAPNVTSIGIFLITKLLFYL